MMPINLIRTNLLVYSCFWLSFFSFTNMLAFLCLVTILASQCLLIEGCLCFLLTIKSMPSRFGFQEWVEQALLAWLTWDCSRAATPLLSLKLLAVVGMVLDLIVFYECSPSALSWVYKNLCGRVERRAVLLKLLLPSSGRGWWAEQAEPFPAHQLSASAGGEARLAKGTLEWVKDLSLVQPSQG